MTRPQDPRTRLQALRLPLDNQADERWKTDHGITDIYVNDIAAGCLVEVPPDWARGEKATERVSRGLRRLVQELWAQDLARPVVAVFWPGKDAKPEPVGALRKLTWDQEAHRGDFALREARDRDAAEGLLWDLMGDTMGALDDSAREDKAGIAEVIAALREEAAQAEKARDGAWAAPSKRLVQALVDELERARDTRGDPDLVAVLESWMRAEEVAS